MHRGFSPRGTSLRAEQVPKEPIPQIPRRGLQADAFLVCMPAHVLALDVKFQVVLAGQAGNELLIGIGFGSPQFVIKVND